jgi:ribosomal-protein-alanine acetyltransferase
MVARNITVRRMTIQDAYACWELDQRCFADGETYDLDTFQHLLTNPQVVARKIVVPNSAMIGFAVGVIEPGAVGHVISVGVAPEWRRRGLGKLLMDEAERCFIKNGATISRLEVRADNQVAQQLYLKIGYAITQRLSNYYANGGDALIMVKTLPSYRTFWRFRY